MYGVSGPGFRKGGPTLGFEKRGPIFFSTFEKGGKYFSLVIEKGCKDFRFKEGGARSLFGTKDT